MTRQIYQNHNFNDGAKITNLPTPTASTDAAPKGYVDNAVAGLAWKDSVRAATTANGTLATAFENGDTIDGVTLATGDRILLKDQSTGAENGIYTVNASGAPTRATDADTAAEVLGMVAQIEEGTANAETKWVLTTNAPITINTTALVFVQWTGASYTGGNGVLLTGSAFSARLGASGGLAFSGADIIVDTAIVVRKYAANVGDAAASSFNIDHNLGTLDVIVSVHQISDGAEIECGVVKSTTNRVILDFGATVPTSAQFRVVVHA